MDFAITPPPQAFVPVVDGDPFPVRRIYCVGRNYAAHAREMGHDPDREPPFFFMKRFPLRRHSPIGSHAGAWKVAYADFVTGMMSLFLVLWIFPPL